MTVFAAHLRYRALEYLRTPIAIWPTVAFPLMIALFFIVPAAQDVPQAATYGLVSILLLSFTMIAMFTFGAGTAEERRLPWYDYQRTLPVRPTVVIAGRVAVGLVFAVIGALPAVVLITARTAVEVPVARWPLLAVAVLAGALGMTLLGLGLGMALPFKAALPVANIAFFPMAFAGGLFLPLEQLPDWARIVGAATPMRPWVEVATAAAFGEGAPPGWWAALAAWIAALGAFSVWAHRRDAVQRFR
ncbi:ABC transporter permease [Egibacter rhizosphaerae]|uniref:ABC transporter permease n=1 Tax=Egibacter rhizosphaerae TaxID=1670831 RepID=UPI0013F14336|nr:ABC transporter permease [Egibacter rhizosphaerae]